MFVIAVCMNFFKTDIFMLNCDAKKQTMISNGYMDATFNTQYEFIKTSWKKKLTLF